MELRNENNGYSATNLEAILAVNLKLTAENSLLKQTLEHAEQTISWFKEQVKLGQHKRFAAQNESSQYIQLVFDELGEPEVKEQAKVPSTETITYTRQKKSVGRRIDTSKLPKEVVVHDLPENERHCQECGTELEKFGEERSQQLEYIPSQIKVIEHVSHKYTCRCCEKVVTAAKPEMPIAKSMATPSLIAEVIIKKYEHHLPWYRQAKIFAQNGIDIPANTIGNWFMQAGEILLPLKAALKAQLTQTHLLQADETPVTVLTKNNSAYMWAYHSHQANNRFIIFEYNASRAGKAVSDELAKYKGLLQSDGYSGYNDLRKKDEIIALGCWAHCRRYFVNTVKLAPAVGTAHEIVKLIASLYKIESKAKELKLDYVGRQKLRQNQAPPIFQKIYALLTSTAPPPKSTFGKAITYALNQWEYLIKYVDHGEAEIDNNWIENQIRPFAIGRKNWMFIGNEKAAKHAAFFYSLIQTCRLNKIDPRKYLIYVLGQTHKMRRHEVDPQTLLPQFIDRTLLT